MTPEQVKEMLNRECQAEAVYLELHPLQLFQQYIKVLRGEAEDNTGLGLWRIFNDSLDHQRIEKVRQKARELYWQEIGYVP
jgi:hypothetical protein